MGLKLLRVLPAAPPRATLKAIVVLAAVGGFAAPWMNIPIDLVVHRVFPVSLVLDMLLAVLSLAVPIALTCWLIVKFHRFWPVLGASAAAWGVFLIATSIHEYCQIGFQRGSSSPQQHLLSDLALVWGLQVVVGATVFLVAWCAIRGAVVRSVCQTGTLCRRCAYDLVGLPPGARCPECGRAEPAASETPRLGASVCALLSRRGWVVVLLALGADLGGRYGLWRTYVQPELSSLATFGEVRSEAGDIFFVGSTGRYTT